MYKRFFKRFFDFIIAFTVLLIIWPVLLIITIWLYFANKGAGIFFFRNVQGKMKKSLK